MPLYWGFFSSSFMNLIQVFWFVAFGVADRIAISPLLPICLASSCTSLRPRSSGLAWLMNTLRPAGAVSESYVTTLMPCDIARFSEGTTAFGSLAEIAMASTFCEVRVLMYETCDDALASDGPTRLPSPPSVLTASSPPLSEIAKYGLLSCLGRKAIFRPFLTSPPALLAGCVEVEAGVADELDSLLFVEPQAARTSAATSARAAAMSRPGRETGWSMGPLLLVDDPISGRRPRPPPRVVGHRLRVRAAERPRWVRGP